MEQDAISNASAPPLSLSFDMVQGYEDTTSLNTMCVVPPPSPLDYFLYFPDEPPPPYEETEHVHSTVDFVETKELTDDCNKDRDELNERVWFAPNDNHAFNPQWLQAMNINQSTSEYDVTRNLSEEDCVDALSQFVSGNCCYNNGVTKHMSTKEIRPSNGHQYIVESYYEERCTSWHQEPYTHQVVDTAENGPPPAAWDIHVPRPKMFQQKESYVEVPHTASIKDCGCCHGKGQKTCSPCHGSGDMKCNVCDGLGVIHHYAQDEMLDRRSSSAGLRSCHHCNAGRKSCHPCSGSGRITCSTCTGSGRVKVFIRVIVKWKTLKSNKVFGSTKLPKKCITEVSGTLVFQEQNDRVYPLFDFPEDDINSYSRKIINNHEEQLKHGRIIMQRHCVREVPVAEIRSQWKRQEFTYWVYGNEKQVYCPDYPSKCFVACSIL